MVDLTYTLKSKVTHFSLKALEELELLTRDATSATQNIINVSLDESKLRDLCAAIFLDDFSKVQLEEIDIAKVVEGLNRFLSKWLRPSIA